MVGLCALSILVSFSAVGHKEGRFILPAVVLATTLAGIGSVDVVRSALRRAGAQEPAEWRLGLGCAGLWALVSAGLAVWGPFETQWSRGDAMMTAMRLVNADVSACGLGIYPSNQWSASGGASHLRAGIGLYGAGDGASMTARTSSFDYVLALAVSTDGRVARPFEAPGFGKVGCWSDTAGLGPSNMVCLWRRPGGCVAGDGLLTSRSVWFGTGVRP